MKKEKWKLQIIITHERVVAYATRGSRKPPANAGAVAERIAFSPRTHKAITGRVTA